jgi:hypothetical protein
MRKADERPLRRSARGSLARLAVAAAAGAATVLVAALMASPSTGEEDAPGALDAVVEPNCPVGQKALERAADNFARACLPGQDLTGAGPAKGTLAEEESSGDDMKLLANLPKQGAFDSPSALNSDLAFKDHYAFAGNYNGFMVYDVKKPARPRVVAQVLCPGSQNDVSVWRDILVLSVDSSRSDDSCNSTSQSAAEKSSWEGIRVFDISKPAKPRYVAAVETDCGSHTHSLAPTRDGRALYVYVSSYGPQASFPDCQPPHDTISVVKIPTRSPGDASLAATPVLFPDGGNAGGNGSSTTSGCHDITAYPSKDIAAGACMGDGILLDISDREHPVVTEQVRDTTNFAFWHSATFNNTGTKVVFTDELGGGGAPTCNTEVGPNRGADGIYDIVDGELVFRSYYKMPRTQSDTENCVAHNGSLIPVKGKDIMVQAWYQGGISVVDFTDSAHPEEIAWFDRGPVDEENLVIGGSWSAYYYNGYVYSNEIARGFDVLRIQDPRVASAKRVKMDVFNPQSQPSYNG